MSWMNTGWDSLDTAWDNVGGGDRGPRRVWTPPGVTRRFLFLEDIPTTLWEHNYKWNKNWFNWEPCVTRNKLGSECPPCDAYEDRYPYFVGLSTVISLTPWYTKKKKQEVVFQRQIFAAKLGSEDKPGVLKKLRKMHDKNGRLRGYIYDVERPGGKTESCGSEFELVEKIEPGEIKTYAMDQLNAYAKRLNEDAPRDKQTTAEKLWDADPWEPFDFDDVITRHSIEELKKMFTKSGGAESGGGDGGSDGYEHDDSDAPADDDLPY
jgi:hypothetical protein